MRPLPARRRQPRSSQASGRTAVVGLVLVLGSMVAPIAVAPPASAQEQTIWVDPARGDDGASGSSRASAVRTLAEAWRRIPQGTPLTEGVRIAILPGRLTAEMVPNYLESRYGTASAPITIEAAGKRGSVVMASLNVYDVRHLTLRGVRIQASGGDGFHCEKCQNVTIENSIIRGAPRADGSVGDLLKVNQSQYVSILRSDVSGAGDNAIDFVSVQYGQIVGNRIHDAGDWCAYVKGGSAYIEVIGNEIYDCGTGGFTAGQGTGFQFMTPPWLQYEAYGVTVANNFVHDTEGAGLGVNGGYNILLAHNTLMRVGQRSHVAEFVAGGRSCDGQPGDEGRERCGQYLRAGGWGTTAVDTGENYVRIPNRHVAFVNNLIVNPDGQGSQWQQFELPGPYAGPGQSGSGAPNPARFDDDLVIAGNVIWNGPADHPLGIGDSSGCQPSNPTCNEKQLRSDNAINKIQPTLTRTGQPTPATVSALRGIAVPIRSMGWSDVPGGVPAGAMATGALDRDRRGQSRAGDPLPGAFQR
ncbi:MAG: right-handed parallel beta-helix repeat-containing protein [Actinomycetales bacterium]